MCRDSYHALWMALGEGLPRPSQAGSGLTGAGLPPWTQVQAQVWSGSTKTGFCRRTVEARAEQPPSLHGVCDNS